MSRTNIGDLGADAQKWCADFCEKARDKDHVIDEDFEDWLFGYFANYKTEVEIDVVSTYRELHITGEIIHDAADAAVKHLCELSQHPNDKHDEVAMKLGNAADQIGEALSNNEYRKPVKK